MIRNRNQFPWRLSKLAACASAAVLLLGQAVLGQTIPNPSFETDTFTVFPGYISGNSAITGWTGDPATQVGLNPAGGSPFANNGTIPAGNNVAFLQAKDGIAASLSTTISDLVAGNTYKLTFRVNAREDATANRPNLKVYLDGVPVLMPGALADGLTTAQVGGTNPYLYVVFEFVAAATSQTLTLLNDVAAGDHTLLVDDFQITAGPGKWVVEAWNSDADSGVDPTFWYTHAYNFASANNAQINNITFLGVAGGNPAVAGVFSTTYMGNVFTGDGNLLTPNGDGSATLARDFVYGGTVPAGAFQSITFTNLTPGKDYVVTVYSVGWENPSLGSRWVTFGVGSERLTVNQDQSFNDGGVRVSCRYTADSTGAATVIIHPFLGPDNVSMHVYGFSNREAESSFVAPVISAHPRSTVVSPDVPVTFSVVAAGVPLPSYQWRFGGDAIPNATDAAYTTAPASSAAAGLYDVIVANTAGSVTSHVARLRVGDIPIINPSFEVDTFFSWPGYVAGNPGAPDNGPITGWASLNNHGINPANGSPFADNGAIPHGNQVAFMQGAGTMSQSVSGFTVGAAYYVHYYENGRTEVTIPGVEVKVGGVAVMPAHPVPPVGGGNEYREMASAMFVASATALELAFVKSSPQGGDCTALIDNVAIIQVPAGVAPTISYQPQSATVLIREPASFSAVAQGSLPLSYQWRFGGQPIEAATDVTLAIASVGLADEGDYTLVVTNSSGSITSAVARLSLLEPIPSLRNTGIDAGGAPQAGGAVSPFWTYEINPDSTSKDVIVGNDAWPIGTWLNNSTTSKWLGPRATLGDPDIATGDYLYRVTFDLANRDTNTVQIVGRWATDNGGTGIYVNGVAVSVPLSSSFTAWTTFTLNNGNATFLPGINTIDFGVNNAGAGPTGLRVEFTQTSARTLPGIPAAIAIQPQGSTVAEGDRVVMTVSATGTLPITYQWKKNDVDLAGKTDDALTLVNVTTNDNANYRVAVSNAWGGDISSPATVVVAYRPIPGIFGTGLDASGALLPDGVVDPHYVLSASADTTFPGPDALAVTNAWPIQAGVWLLNGPYSRWIAPSADQSIGNAPGSYTFQTTFNLTGYDLAKVHLTGGVAADNAVTDVLVNGVSTSFTVNGFNALTPFMLPGTALLPGANTLDIIVSNAETTAGDPFTPNPAGLRVDIKGYLDIRPAAPTTLLQIIRNGDSVSVSWSPTATGQKLQWAPAVTGPWEEITGAANPYSTTASGTAKFYRIVQ